MKINNIEVNDDEINDYLSIVEKVNQPNFRLKHYEKFQKKLGKKFQYLPNYIPSLNFYSKVEIEREAQRLYEPLGFDNYKEAFEVLSSGQFSANFTPGKLEIDQLFFIGYLGIDQMIALSPLASEENLSVVYQAQYTEKSGNFINTWATAYENFREFIIDMRMAYKEANC